VCVFFSSPKTLIHTHTKRNQKNPQALKHNSIRDSSFDGCWRLVWQDWFKLWRVLTVSMAGLTNTARLAALQGGHHHHSRRHVHHAVLCDKEGGLGMSLKKVTMALSHQESGSSSLDTAAGSSRSIKQLLTITQPDDWHLHLRDNDGLAAVAPHRFYNKSSSIVCCSSIYLRFIW
jgi:hypothetical protein